MISSIDRLRCYRYIYTITTNPSTKRNHVPLLHHSLFKFTHFLHVHITFTSPRHQPKPNQTKPLYLFDFVQLISCYLSKKFLRYDVNKSNSYLLFNIGNNYWQEINFEFGEYFHKFTIGILNIQWKMALRNLFL